MDTNHITDTEDLHALGVLRPARIPRNQTLTSCLGLGPMPFTKIVKCYDLVRESSQRPGSAPAHDLSNQEDSARTTVEACADRWIDKQVNKSVESEIAKIKSLHAEINYLDHEVEATKARHYVGPNGETLTADTAHTTHQAAVEQIKAETAAGDVRHRRVPHGAKKRVTSFLALDFAILFLVLMRYFNVNFMNFWTTPGGVIKAATSLVFAVFGTLLVAFAMKTLGHRHRPYRNAHGGWTLPRGARTILAVEIGVAALVIAALAGVMAWRFVIDGPQNDAVLTALMAGLFALVTGATAYLAYMTEFADGSSTTDTIDTLASQLHATAAIIQGLQRKQEILTQEASRRLAALNRHIEATRSGAVRRVVQSSTDKAIRYARSIHNRSGHGGALPEPRLNFARLDLAARQASQLDALQAAIEARLRDEVDRNGRSDGPSGALAVAS